MREIDEPHVKFKKSQVAYDEKISELEDELRRRLEVPQYTSIDKFRNF